MSRGFFITGTDTGVGKTVVACGLAAAFRESGFKVGVMKPAESGCRNERGRLTPRDASFLKAASGSEESIDRICPYRLGVPAAPSVAAARAGIQIRPDFLVRLCRDMGDAFDLMVVEGAGGLLVPLVSTYTYADLARELGLAVVVVAGNRLGAVNHTLLTLEHAACLGLDVSGYILNDVESESTPAAATNAQTIGEMTRTPCLGRIPFLRAQGDAGEPETRPDLGSLFKRHTEFGHLEEILDPVSRRTKRRRAEPGTAGTIGRGP